MAYIKTLHILLWSVEFMVWLLLVDCRVFFTAYSFLSRLLETHILWFKCYNKGEKGVYQTRDRSHRDHFSISRATDAVKMCVA